MEVNVGGTDRQVRFILTPLLVALAIVFFIIGGTTAIVLGLVSLVLAGIAGVTAYLQKCPANSLLGINTANQETEMESGTEVKSDVETATKIEPDTEEVKKEE